MKGIEAACGESDQTNNDQANYLSDFFEKVYDNMDDYYCVDYICPCKIDPDTFKNADSADVSYYASLNGTGDYAINFQWC